MNEASERSANAGERSTFIKQLLECDFLGLIRKWLHPLSDGALPSFQVRSQVLAALHKMPDLAGEEMVGYLRRSEIGKTLMLLWKHKDEHTHPALAHAHEIHS